MACHDGVPLGLGSHRQRSVLGLLAINPGLTIHRDSIIDALWGVCPPATAVAMVQSYVSRLRRILHVGQRRAGTLETLGIGYRLQPGEAFDLTGFTGAASLAAAARSAGDAATACELYQQALEMWHGEPVADLELLRRHPAVETLRQRRAAAVVGYADAACALGDPGRVLPFLSELAAGDPLDERVHAHLMIALAGAGQQAAALTVYEQLTGRLDRELGVRPGAELVRAQQRVLRQDLPTAGMKAAGAAGRSCQREPSPSRRAGSRVSVCPGRVRTRP